MKYFSVFVLLFLLAGCQQNNEPTTTAPSKTNASSSKENTHQKPYDITVQQNGEQLIFKQGGYTWSYKENGEYVTVTTDHASPNQMVDLASVPPLQLTDDISIEWPVEPDLYTINVWEDENIVGSYHSFSAITQTGPIVIEVVGEWPEGRGTYVAGFDVK